MANGKDILILEEFTATSFAGISHDKPVIIDFTKMRKGQKVVEFFGDQGTRKSSSLLGVIYAMGGRFKLKKEQLLNSKDKKLDVSLKFQYEGETYLVEADDTRAVVKKMQENGKWKVDQSDSPMNILKKIFGPVGLSPFAVREMTGKKQIEYFQQLFGSGEDATKKMLTLENEIKTKFTKRTGVNSEAKSLSSSLELEPLFQNYEKSQERFKTVINAEKEQKAFQVKVAAKATYDKNATNLSILNIELKNKQSEIDDLKKKLAAAEEAEKGYASQIQEYNVWMEANKNVTSDHDAANKAWITLSQTLADQEKWKGILAKEKQMIEKQEESITLTDEIETGREKLLKLTNSVVPKVEGLSLKVAVGLDDTNQLEGVFYQVPGKKDATEQAIHELSQSEYEAMWAEIFSEADIPFLFFENMNNFGSATIGLLTRLSRDKDVVIFGTRTDSTVKEMGVEFRAKL